MKIIFLDFDGTLITQSYNVCFDVSLEEESRRFKPKAIRALNEITDATKASIIISSTWRLFFDLESLIKILRLAGVTGDIIGQTSTECSILRDTEIKNWLELHPEVSKFVILDDWSIPLYEDNLIQTQQDIGLTSEQAKLAISLLN